MAENNDQKKVNDPFPDVEQFSFIGDDDKPDTSDIVIDGDTGQIIDDDQNSSNEK